MDYRNISFEHGGSSAEAKLFRIEHPELGAWARDEETLGWEPIDTGEMTLDTYIKKLKIDVEYAEEDDIYDSFKTKAQTVKQLESMREAYLIENPSYARARIERDAYTKGIPGEYVNLYIQYKEGGYIKGSSRGDAWLWKHYDFFLAVREIMDWGPLETHTIVGTSLMPGWKTGSYLPGEFFVPARY
jgi:hypothetical protein